MLYSGILLAALQVASPNGIEICPSSPFCEVTASTINSVQMSAAWSSTDTTDAQRAKMRSFIEANTKNGTIDWRSASEQYFAWRAKDQGYDLAKLRAQDAARDLALSQTAAQRSASEGARYRLMREAGEQAIRASLIDPSSAEFEWPNGFLNGYWKPILQRRVSGYVTCGVVNAKNRLGGYVGRSHFVVVVQDNRVVYSDMDSGSSGLVQAGCAKTPLPPPQDGMLGNAQTAPATSSGVSTADELAKLAALRDKGVLTQAEFDAQKAKVLNR